MAYGRAIMAAVVAGVIAACGASSAPSPTLDGTPSDAPSAAIAPTATPTTSPTPTNAERSPTLSPDQQEAPTSTPAPVPPTPTGVAFDERREGDDPSSTEITQTVTWAAPRSADVEIRVYGVTECIGRPEEPDPNTSGPCLVARTSLPASVRMLLATAPASDGAVSWTWTGTFDCGEPDPAYDPQGPAYYAVVLAAYSTSGHSIFAIAAPGEWWEPGPGEIVC